MSPTYVDGDILFCVKKSVYAPGDVVIASLASGKETIKRITAVQSTTVELRGDNSFDSFDSREYGPVPKRAILGSVMMKIRLPKALPPEPLQHPRALILLYAAGFISVIIVLLQLVKFEDMVAVVTSVTSLSGVGATVAATAYTVSILLGIPVLLQLTLSPLARATSRAALVVAPLLWLSSVLLFGGEFAKVFTADVLGSLSVAVLLTWFVSQGVAAYYVLAGKSK